MSQSQNAMKRRLVKPIAAITALGLSLLGLSACTGDAPEDDSTITIFAPQSAQQDLETNEFTLLLEDKFDVDLVFETTSYEGSAAAEARQIAIASGDLPDAFMLINWVNQFSQTELLRYGKQGLILPLNDLIAEYAPDIQAAFDETPAYEELATAPDGTVWGIPMWNDCYHCSYGAKFWINSDWLEAVGMDMPSTPDEFFDVMMAFKTQDPNGNGQADEIPLTTQSSSPFLHFIMNAFIYSGWTSPAQPWSLGLDGDTVQIQPAQDGWREGLKFLNKLWDNGLIDPAAFSQTIVAVLLMFLFDTLMSAGIGLKRMMAIVAYGFLPTLLQTALSMVVLFLKDPEDFNLQNPLMFNVGAYLSSDSPAALRALGSSIDLFSLWIIVLLAIGISAAGRRISFGKALGGIAIPWAILWA